MFDGNNEEKKLDWMYKASTVDREEYLLGRTVDKSLEQLNATENKTDIKQPKNHVEHECIPPSIRDFQNLTSSEQVDLQQKLQEDPLVAIKKQEEETRRRLLQNPVQLKKLQDVLKMRTKPKKSKKKKKDKKSDSEDEDLKEKYLRLKNSVVSKQEPEDLDAILLEKFKSLKKKLGSNIDEILNMDTSSDDSDNNKKSKSKKSKKKKHKRKHSSSESSDSESENEVQRKKHHKNSHCIETLHKRSYREADERYSRKEDSYRHKKDHKKYTNDKNESRNRSPRRYDSNTDRYKMDKHTRDNEEKRYRNNSEEIRRNKRSESFEYDDHKKDKSRERKDVRHLDDKHKREYKNNDSDFSEEEHIQKTKKTEITRNSSEERYDKKYRNRSPSSDTENESDKHNINSDSENERKPKIVNYGLVKADGSKIPLTFRNDKYDKPKVNDKQFEEKKIEKTKYIKLTDEEKEQRRREMLENAKWRDNERESNIKRYRAEDSRELQQVKEYNPDFLKDQLRKSASGSTVESRIKSNINNIQRSKNDMNSHFSRRY